MAHKDLLVGPETRDDAAVYRVAPDLALVVTADFITPIVDDPVAFGAIAAANSLSDVWAMGGEPLIALNLVGFPRDQLEIDVLTEIISAGGAAAHEAGCLVVGGHTIDDPELKYGLSVVGRVHPDHIVRNSTAQPGDVLYLTKPLGLGIITTAVKRGVADPATLEKAVALMRHFNRAAARVMTEVGVAAATDVTGFGLLGHLGEMARASKLAALVDSAAVPVLDGVRDLAGAGVVPGGTERNLQAAEKNTTFPVGMELADRLILADAQTSGGLLIALSKAGASQLESALAAAGEMVAPIGRLQAGLAGLIEVH